MYVGWYDNEFTRSSLRAIDAVLCCTVLYNGIVRMMRLALKPLKLQSDAFARTNTSYNTVESIVVVVFY